MRLCPPFPGTETPPLNQGRLCRTRARAAGSVRRRVRSAPAAGPPCPPDMAPAAERIPGRTVEPDGLSTSLSRRLYYSLPGVNRGGPVLLPPQLGLAFGFRNTVFLLVLLQSVVPAPSPPERQQRAPPAVRSLSSLPVITLSSILSLYPLFCHFILHFIALSSVLSLYPLFCRFILSRIRFKGALALHLLDIS